MKVHVWVAISWKGRTPIVIFDGILNVEGYKTILEQGLIPFLHDVYPGGHRLMQDNDPKQISNWISHILDEKEVNWWKTPLESLDCNPIENLWHELKEYLIREVKPSRKADLVAGIDLFWETMDIAKCQKYIRHLRKALPKVIECNSGPTGYYTFFGWL